VVHASGTDHRIPRRPIVPFPPRGLEPGALPLVAFRAGGTAPEVERDLGIALARAGGRLSAGGTQATIGRLARDRLTASLARWRGDAEAWAAMSAARAACGEPNERLSA